MTEIMFRFVIELSEETRNFIKEIIDEIKDSEYEEGDSGIDSDTTV